jgi:hypothetical protein
MNLKATSIFILSLSIATTAFSQARGQGSGRPAGVGGAPSTIERGRSAEHIPTEHGQANKPSTSGTESRASRSEMSSKLSENSALATRLQGMLPAGTDLLTAADGFRNFGQFVAAVQLSKNQNIAFDLLKTEMVTGNKSLSDAVHTLKPELSESEVNAEAKKAENQASQDMKK